MSKPTLNDQINELATDVLKRAGEVIVARNATIAELREALKGLYVLLPRYSCRSNEPDGCAVCVARKLLREEKK